MNTCTFCGEPITGESPEQSSPCEYCGSLSGGYPHPVILTAEEGDKAGERATREVVSTRVVGATRELVFQAFADPEHLVRWWGPTGFTNTFHEFDLRPGGAWRFVMHGPDGVNYRNRSVFVEIVKPERIVFEHVSGPQFRMTIALAEQGDKTRITWRMLFASTAGYDQVKKYVIEGNEQNFDRLEAELAKMA
jgi:uncharacterized protein YndB with AHSA1/START domain